VCDLGSHFRLSIKGTTSPWVEMRMHTLSLNYINTKPKSFTNNTFDHYIHSTAACGFIYLKKMFGKIFLSHTTYCLAVHHSCFTRKAHPFSFSSIQIDFQSCGGDKISTMRSSSHLIQYRPVEGALLFVGSTIGFRPITCRLLIPCGSLCPSIPW